MYRLNDRAYRRLKRAYDDYARHNSLAQAQRQIFLRRLQTWRDQRGEPATYEELRALVIDLLPDFDDRTLRQAARDNQPPGALQRGFGTLVWLTGGLALAAGGLWVVNLPYPPIRKPVSEVAPLLLLPSFYQMDHGYRSAIAAVSQGEQLIDRATSAVDFEVGAEQVSQGKAALDKLPVWFLGYSPQVYCQFFGCTWRFTLDEFEATRRSIARMEAKIFQERNALKGLEAATIAANQAKATYQTATDPTAKTAAVAAWQGAIDQLREVPPTTLAGKQAQTKLAAQQRDFQQAAGFSLGNERAGNLVTVAKNYAMQAAIESQKPPHPAATWERVAGLWQRAIAELGKINDKDPDYVLSRQLMADYEKNLGIINQRLGMEKTSVQALDQAKTLVADWRSRAAANPSDPTLIGGLQAIVNQLDRVQADTTVSAEATELQQFATARLKTLQP